MGKSLGRKLREYFLYTRGKIMYKNPPVIGSGKQIPSDVKPRKLRKKKK